MHEPTHLSAKVDVLDYSKIDMFLFFSTAPLAALKSLSIQILALAAFCFPFFFIPLA